MKVFYSILFFSLASLTGQAQFGKMLKDKAKKAVEKKINSADTTTSSSGSDSSSNAGMAERSTAEYSDEEFKKELEKKYPNDQAKQDLYYQKYLEKKAKESKSNAIVNTADSDEGFLYLSYTFGMSSGVNSYAVDQVKLRRQMTDRGDNVDILPKQDTEYAWLRFLTTPELEMMSPDGYIGYELVSGSYVTKIGADRSQTMELGTGMPVLTRGMLIAEDVFVIYAGSHQGGHAFNVPSYMDQDDITIMNIVGKGDQQFHLEWLEKAKPIVKEFEATLKANYDKAAKASMASIKMPKAGTMNGNSELKNFAIAKVKETIARDGAQLLKLNIESSDWSIVKNKYTGHILYRWIKGSFTEKNKNKDCMLQGFLIKQEYNGSGYGSSQFGGIIHGQMPYGQLMDCANAM
ncbi:hypothetical protein DI487_00730 [Flavobacterium sediminis]|uniref:DUF4412 domain-containing protein n=1 Tax=Flavobacterium sediminis TaxID=2201181 RepID=A0A2U8QR11_9FLAO|nr:hypothetical protein [Flavobacterium sediminis]AWM12538.1 hypothetical protein DI487_00730 [Flavobacterium sediminis]